MKVFDITDVSSWEKASDTIPFTWKDKSFLNEETGKDITENEFVTFIGQAISMLRQISSDEKIASAGLSNIIALFVDLIDAGISANNALLLIKFGFDNDVDFSWHMIKEKQTINTNNEVFDIEDMNTWGFATEKNLIWEGKPFNISPEKIFTEMLFVKTMFLLLGPNLPKCFLISGLSNITISIVLDGLRQKKIYFSEILEQIANQIQTITNQRQNKNNIPISQVSGQSIIDSTVPHSNNNSYQSQVNTNTTKAYDLSPPSKIFLALGVGLLICGVLYLFSADVRDWTPSKLIFSVVIIFCSLPLFIKQASEQSKYFFKAVCADMAQWVGRYSNDLIVQWGAPTKTYKFPSDKTMTVLEYKDSIRNYAGYRYKGMYAGQAKTTKYIKSFFVKDGIIVNYKYAIT
jgi:hypothetical protein